MAPPESKTSKRRIRARERELRALELRKAGLTYRQIGEQLGITRAGARAAVRRALKRLDEQIGETAREVLQLEMGRLDAIQVAVWPRALKGDYKAVDRVLRIMRLRADLLGLGQSRVQVEMTRPVVVRVEWEDSVREALLPDGEGEVA